MNKKEMEELTIKRIDNNIVDVADIEIYKSDFSTSLGRLTATINVTAKVSKAIESVEMAALMGIITEEKRVEYEEEIERIEKSILQMKP